MSVLLRLSCLSVLVLALVPPARAEEDFLPPNVAFQFSSRMADANTVEATWRIAEGYYMYREQFKFRAAGAELGAAGIPPGKIKFDETFNKNVEIFRHKVTIRVPVTAKGAFTLTAIGQGCADKGLCYSPQDATVRLSATGGATTAPMGGFAVPSMSRPTMR
ncbi:protein-disulfide reductase DsbD domain-containing protein [Massilia sp. METH4]|uniref:protein-disulfide reductase DsbD domain-containing protein n=1 Tax=Massilia sp. METH4 TaxID=3123041 RepID=UPI0030CED717